MINGYSLRPAALDDLPAINRLVESRDYVHRHLDWRLPEDWLGLQPFWLLEKEGRTLAALAFPCDPPGIAWVRFFAAMPNLRLNETWKVLFYRALETLDPKSIPIIVSVAVQKWYADLLLQNGFIHYQDIVVLEWRYIDGIALPANDPGLTLRLMTTADFEAVEQVDEAAFEPLWHYSYSGIEQAYKQSAYSTVIELDGKIIGYQISSATAFNAHLARLAVVPDLQRGHIGFQLVEDMLQHFSQLEIPLISVNTQHNNSASIALYKKTGFRLTGERFPVFTYPSAQA